MAHIKIEFLPHSLQYILRGNSLQNLNGSLFEFFDIRNSGTHETLAITSDFFKISISQNLILEIRRIKLVLFVINPIEFHFSLPNII